MAGYTCRNFLSLTIPSILGLSILYILKKRSSNCKQAKEAVQFEDTLSDNLEHYPTLYPMKLKHPEESSVEETVNAEMQLKETESNSEMQCQIPNGVSHHPKLKGREENMARLHENGNSCSYEEPMTNGYRKDKAPHRNGDSKPELTNGMNALCLNGVSKAKESFTNGTNKFSEIEKMQNGINNITNGFENSPESSCKSEIQASSSEDEMNPKVSVSDAEINKSLLNFFELADAKNQLPVNDNEQSSSECNGTCNAVMESDSCSIEEALPAEKLLSTLSNHQTVAVSNGLQSSTISSTTDVDLLTDTNEKLIETENPECEEINTEQQFVSMSENLDEHSSQMPDSVELLSPTSHSLASNVVDHSAPLVNYILADNDPTVPINVVTDTEHLEPLVDYVVVDSTELLTLPIDDIGSEIQGEMLESPGATYCDSLECHPSSSTWCFSDSFAIDSRFFTPQQMEYQQSPWSAEWHSNVIVTFIQEMGSSDSGRGPSETYQLTEDQFVYMVYEFEIFPEDCGRLIGRLGRHVKHINKQTNANIVIKKHPCCTDKKLCAITGTENEINAALKLIRKRFPVEHYPSVTLAQINNIPITTLFSPETLKLSLPEGGVFEALLCSTVSAGHFFLQQPTHPTFYQLPPLTNAMNALYGQSETPVLENPTKGNICAAEIGGGWYRAEIDEVYEDSDNCRLKFLDYGGYADIPTASIRKIKCDFMLIPFQATECYLAGVMPLDENGWSAEATESFEQEAQGQLIQGFIAAYAENRIPFVNLYKITGVESVFINHKLINDGFAKGINMD